MPQHVTPRPDPSAVKALAALQSMDDGVITADPDGQVDILNPVAEALTGWRQDEARGRRLAEIVRIIDERTRKPVADLSPRVLREGRGACLPEHALLVDRHGTDHAIEATVAPIRGDAGATLGVVLVFRNVTEKRRLDDRMLYEATHDSLTDLVNRAEFEKRLDRAIAAFYRRGTACALCYLDLDEFKVINDAAGHMAGDEMLRQIAPLLKTKVRSRDTLARMGGDEFGLLLENCPIGNALEIARDLVSSVRDFRFNWQGRHFVISLSVGVAVITPDVNEGAQLLTRADTACYAAKDRGGGRVHLYESGDSGRSRYHREIPGAAALREALDNDLFRLYAEPIRASTDPLGRTLYHEVLIRLPGSEGEPLLPESLIPAAERSGVMGEVDRWVIREAMQQFTAVRAQCGEAGIAINLSGSSLGDDRLVGFVAECLASSGIQAGEVCIELNAVTVVSRRAMAEHMIRALRELGCRVALDDFGTGLYSFAYLKQLPVDYLKIDGSLVRNACGDPVVRAMVKAVNEVAHAMGTATVAESVETEQCLATVRDLGVDFVQGFAIGRPRLLADLRP